MIWIDFRQSNLDEHSSFAHKVCKKSRKLHSPVKVRAYSEHLKRMNYVGMNLYKVVEMWKNYHPDVPPVFHDNVLYIEPTAAQWAKVKVARMDQSEFMVANKLKYAMKEMIETMIFDGEGGV